MPHTPSTRWCPTPEQLMILEEMYRSGVRTPNASQIQQITAHLSIYGRIEGKNVFYWFQNHKARDRQKLRRHLSRQYHLLHGFTSIARHPHRLHNLEEAPLTPTFHHSQPLHFLHQGAPDQEAAQGMNLLCKLEAGDALAPLPESTATYSFEWMMMMTGNSNPCCRPLKTLDLFPTMSTGFKDEYSTSKFSS